jgi:hypothetical protein
VTTNTNMPIPFVSGDEHDALTGWRKVLKFRPGERKEIKRRYQRRVRRTMNEATRQEGGQ